MSNLAIARPSPAVLSAPDPAAVLVLTGKRKGPGEVFVQKGDRVWKGQAEVSPTTDTVGNVLQPGDYFGIVSINSKEVHRAAVVVPKGAYFLQIPYGHILNQKVTVERIVQLKKLEVDIFQGNTLPQTRVGYVFGGQFVGQALAAASKSVDPSLLRSYFISVGDESLPVVYQVHRVRDGYRFATRKQYFYFDCIIPERRAKHCQCLMRQAQSRLLMDIGQSCNPLSLTSRKLQLLSHEQIEKILLRPVREAIAAFPLKQHPLDIRSCDPIDLANPVDSEPRQRVWLRSKERLSDDQAMHRCVAAYASDWIFLQTVLRPYKSSGKQYRLLSLDHSLWFHKPLKADDWLLYAVHNNLECVLCGWLLKIRSPRASGSSHMYNRTGT